MATDRMRPLVTDLLHDAVRSFAERAPFRDYVDADALLVVATRGRRGMVGKRAACHFTRFKETGERISADGRWEFPSVHVAGREIRYILSFVLPRFLFLDPKEQAEDVVHELLHIDRSFGGFSSPLRHGSAYDARVRTVAAAARDDGAYVPPLATGTGDAVWFRRLRPFPHPFLRQDRTAKRWFDDDDVEVARLTVDPLDRVAAPPRYVYVCPACGTAFPRQKPLLMASSCGECADRYDGRFKLKLVRSSPSG